VPCARAGRRTNPLPAGAAVSDQEENVLARQEVAAPSAPIDNQQPSLSAFPKAKSSRLATPKPASLCFIS